MFFKDYIQPEIVGKRCTRPQPTPTASQPSTSSSLDTFDPTSAEIDEIWCYCRKTESGKNYYI